MPSQEKHVYDASRLRKQLVLHEGLKLEPYKCTADKWTIGVGHNFQDVPLTDRQEMIIFGTLKKTFQETLDAFRKKPMTKEQAMFLLDEDIQELCIKKMQGKVWWEAVKGDDVRTRVLIDLCFNMGIATLSSFKNTLAAVARKDWDAAADGLQASKWFKQVGKRGPRIVQMLRTGKDSKDFDLVKSV